MKNKRRIFASLAAIFLVANMTTSTVMAADIETANDQPSATQSNNNQETNKETEFKQLATKYKWTAGDNITDQVMLNTPEKRTVYLQKWNGKKYVNCQTFTTDETGSFKLTFPSNWYRKLKTTWRLCAPATNDATAATSDKITISTVRRYQIPAKYRQLHMKDLHIKGFYSSPLDKSLNYASTREDYVKAFIKRGYQYKKAKTAWVNFTTKQPGTSVDCSGLVMQCMYATGIDPSPANPRWHATHEWGCRSFVKSKTLQTVSLKHLKRGDLIFYGRPKPACYHIGIYLGKNKVLHSWPGAGVTVWPANFKRYYYAKRVFPITKTVSVHEKN
ncbi:C40 family peptidase [Lactobacillus panisapium]|uniref:C40 family peptidase n=1 Tax=Lactobacillus panisapium TaxID=2012495 RepID=UPI001C6995A5|nr:NlpC/P60 family protein [Lactobacillus panisapium]QYN58992.1 C40 family peptidase [Lactobacillus panisapium]